ncbi:MAG: aminodeoxychorismate synthase component I [Acidobacteria bacterium]|nr:aminodeoxychorismate synthase component I [Acidobacteriota bacterium]
MQARFDFGPAHRSPLLFRSPDRVVVARTLAEVPAAMAAVDEGLRDGLYAAGYVAYEAAPAFDRALTTHAPSAVPLVYFGLFPSVEAAASLTGVDLPAPIDWTPELSAADHARGVAAIREAIAEGETYQINYTFRLRAALNPLGLEALYLHLAGIERVPYAAFLDLGDWQVLSLSPELFFQLDNGRLVTRPIKGTALRGRWAEEDAALGEALRASEKNRAENVMIVDLCRNDLSRVCEVGTVRASALCEVEPYQTVWQMVSTVEGQVRPGIGLDDVFGALFPAGSITGAPKSSSMRLIASLEHSPRGVYCGAIGFASPDGRAEFNVAIRTLTVSRSSGAAEYGVGGGITWDSTPADEHAEALSKAACLEIRPPFGLIETMRLEQGALVRVERHLDRLAESASYFGFACDLTSVRAALAAHVATGAPGPARVRLVLYADGQVQVERHSLETPAAGSLPFTLASIPIDGRNRFVCHKTTRREMYDRHKAMHPDVFDVLLWNDRRELTEFTRGNVVVEREGVLWTPPRTCGLLAGVFRLELLAAGTIHERVLTLEDLPTCTRIWFINSLREWVTLHP